MKKSNYNNDELKPFVLEDPPDYGKPNYGYEFINKHHEKINAALWLLVLLWAVITCKVFYEHGQEKELFSTKANVSVTVTRHSEPFRGLDFNKRYEVIPKLTTAIDSMWAAEKEKRDSLKAAEAEKRKQFVRDSILAYAHKKDSIRSQRAANLKVRALQA